MLKLKPLFIVIFSANIFALDDVKINLNRQFFLTSKAAAMGGAISTIPDNISAPYHNPAGIGGLYYGKDTPPFIRQLHFPYVGFSDNANMAKIIKNLKDNPTQSAQMAQSIVDATKEKRNMGRFSTVFDLVFKRFILIQATDIQLASYRIKENQAKDSKAKYQNGSILGFGFSYVNTAETFYLGLFSYSQHLSVFEGYFRFLDITNTNDRKKAFNDGTVSYSATGTNAGLIWVLNEKYKNAISLVLHNVGGLKYQSTKTDLDLEQATTIGYSISPFSERWGWTSIVFQVDSIENPYLALDEKIKTGLEFNLFKFGDRSPLSLRTGYNAAGFSYGIRINLGLLEFEYTSYINNITANNEKFFERKNMAVFAVNVLDD